MRNSDTVKPDAANSGSLSITIIIALVAVLVLGFRLLSATQLRYLQTLTEIAAEFFSASIFRLLLELRQGFLNQAPPNGTANGVNGNVPQAVTRS